MTRYEQERAQALWEASGNLSEVSRHLDRSRNVIRNNLEDPEQYRSGKYAGRVSKVTAQDKRGLLRGASNSKKSAARIGNEVKVPVRKCRVQQILSASPNLKKKEAQESSEADQKTCQ